MLMKMQFHCFLPIYCLWNRIFHFQKLRKNLGGYFGLSSTYVLIVFSKEAHRGNRNHTDDLCSKDHAPRPAQLVII